MRFSVEQTMKWGPRIIGICVGTTIVCSSVTGPASFVNLHAAAFRFLHVNIVTVAPNTIYRDSQLLFVARLSTSACGAESRSSHSTATGVSRACAKRIEIHRHGASLIMVRLL